MIGLIGHLGSGAVTACSDAPYAARASDRASRGAPPQSAPRQQSQQVSTKGERGSEDVG